MIVKAVQPEGLVPDVKKTIDGYLQQAHKIRYEIIQFFTPEEQKKWITYMTAPGVADSRFVTAPYGLPEKRDDFKDSRVAAVYFYDKDGKLFEILIVDLWTNVYIMNDDGVTVDQFRV